MKKIVDSKYGIVYVLDGNCYLFIEYVVNSHIIVPELILKDYKDKDTRIYYINMENNNIMSSSVKRFNAKFGYYSLRFEEFLNRNYETNIGKIKKQIEKNMLDNPNLKQCTINIDEIQKFLDSSLIRNPQFVSDINKISVSSKAIYKGYNTEQLMRFQNDNMEYFFKKYNICILINMTDEGLIISSELFSNIFLKNVIVGLIVPLHPKYGIVMIPKNEKIYFPNNCYILIEDINILHHINQRIYLDCKRNLINVIGIKGDLIKLN